MKIKNYFLSKNFGYYVSLVVTLLLLVTGIFYTVKYAGSEYHFYHVCTTIFTLLGVVASIVLLATKQDKYVPYVQALCDFIALLFFAKGIYLYVVGMEIDYPKTFFPDLYKNFITSCVLLGTTLVISIANCFFPQIKEAKEEKAEEVK